MTNLETCRHPKANGVMSHNENTRYIVKVAIITIALLMFLNNIPAMSEGGKITKDVAKVIVIAGAAYAIADRDDTDEPEGNNTLA